MPRGWSPLTGLSAVQCQSPHANQFRLVLHTAAYWLMLAFRVAVPRRMPLGWSEFTTLRKSLLNIGARVVEKAARIHFASACPDATLYRMLAGRLTTPRTPDPRGGVPREAATNISGSGSDHQRGETAGRHDGQLVATIGCARAITHSHAARRHRTAPRPRRTPPTPTPDRGAHAQLAIESIAPMGDDPSPEQLRPLAAQATRITPGVRTRIGMDGVDLPSSCADRTAL